MGLNEKITEYFELTVENSSQRILSALSDQKQKQTWTDFIFSDSVDFKGIKINDKGLEIIRVPSVLNPFKAHGRITFDLLDTDNNQVTVKCKILPHDGIFPFILGFYFTFFSLWTIVSFLIVRSDSKALLIVIPSWVIFGLIIYMGLRYTKSGLRNYSQRIVKELMTDK